MGRSHGGAVHLLVSTSRLSRDNCDSGSNAVRFIWINFSSEVLTSAERCGMTSLINRTDSQGFRVVPGRPARIRSLVANGKYWQHIPAGQDFDQSCENRRVS